METKHTKFSRIEVLPTGELQVRLAKVVLADDQTIVGGEYHRFRLDPGVSLDAMVAAVNDDLAQNYGYPPIDIQDVERIRRIAGAEHTPERVRAFKEARDRARATPKSGGGPGEEK